MTFFRFFKLPPELRNKVYEFAIIKERGIRIETRPAHRMHCSGAAVLLTCRKMNEKAQSSCFATALH